MTSTATPRAAVRIDLGQLRVAGAAMLGAALVRPLLPGAPGIPCPLRSLTGLPCPLCGMTTSVTAAVHLRGGDALAANPAGVAAVAVAVALLALRRPPAHPVPRWAVVAAVAGAELFQLARLGLL